MMRAMRFLLAALLAACAAAPASPSDKRNGSYQDLLSLFAEWRAFQRPRLAQGVPDYSAAAMETQHRELAGWMRRLESFDASSWTIAQRNDLQLVRAEMNGLDFDHRVLRPWARDPAFYATLFDEESDQPAREGPQSLGSVELWKYSFPLAPAQAAELAAGLQPIPALLEQARGNLTGDARDLWIFGIERVKEQRAMLADLSGKVAEHAGLASAVKSAQQATDDFIRWLEQQAPSKSRPSGVGIENYDWYLAHVQLLPYTWAEEIALVQRELARAWAGLALEEEKNRALPPQVPVAFPEEHQRKFNAAVSEYMAFLRDRHLLTLRDWMDSALRARIGRFAPGEREFFTEVDYRDPVVLRTHSYHYIDLGFLQREPHPSAIRRVALLYNIFDSRTEGFATAMEELMMHAGLFEARPRSRELIYILLAQRAARALGDLRMHANQVTLEEAARFASENTPRGWLRLTGKTVRWEQHLYLQQPGYGTSYVIGKIEVDKLIAARARKLGERFSLRSVIDDLNAAGLIPISLLRKELTPDAAP
jgi:hypothetical protein